jgi:hypothetical protein
VVALFATEYQYCYNNVNENRLVAIYMRSWLVAFFLISVLASPILTVSPNHLSEFESTPKPTGGTNISVTPNSGWTTGGETITITGTGFSNLAYNNITTDGQTYSWTVSTVDYVQGGHGDQAVAVTSNGDVHIVYYNYDTHQLKHAVYDGTSWSRSVIVSNSGSMDYRDVEMVVDGNDHLTRIALGDWRLPPLPILQWN